MTQITGGYRKARKPGCSNNNWYFFLSNHTINLKMVTTHSFCFQFCHEQSYEIDVVYHFRINKGRSFRKSKIVRSCFLLLQSVKMQAIMFHSDIFPMCPSGGRNLCLIDFCLYSCLTEVHTHFTSKFANLFFQFLRNLYRVKYFCFRNCVKSSLYRWTSG